MTDLQTLNGPFEVGLRLLLLLDTAAPSSLDVTELVLLDHLLIHSGEFGGPPSPHPDLPVRSSELGVKRTLVKQALEVLIRAELVTVEGTNEGIMFAATNLSPAFVDSLESSHTIRLKAVSRWAVDQLGSGGRTVQEHMRLALRQWEPELPGLTETPSQEADSGRSD